MNEAFQAFIFANRAVAIDRGVLWELAVAPDGAIAETDAWLLTKLVNSPDTPHRLGDLGSDTKTLPVLNQRLTEMGRSTVEKRAFSPGWQELIKAVTIDQLLVRRNTPAHIAGQVVRSLRVLATAVLAHSGAEPWAMTADDILFACDVANKVQASGKLGELVASVIKTVIDAKHLCDLGPFSHIVNRGTKGGRAKRRPQMLGSLSDRKAVERLPELRALWELVRIVFTEKPKNFVDAIRFAQLRVQILCGFRVGEVCTIPIDWKIVKEHVVLEGRSPGELGGVSKSLMLRHFAEKQQGRDANSVELIESAQHVPLIFEDILVRTLERVAAITSPLRTRLRQQCESGRFLPELSEDALVFVFRSSRPANPVHRDHLIRR